MICRIIWSRLGPLFLERELVLALLKDSKKALYQACIGHQYFFSHLPKWKTRFVWFLSFEFAKLQNHFSSFLHTLKFEFCPSSSTVDKFTFSAHMALNQFELLTTLWYNSPQHSAKVFLALKYPWVNFCIWVCSYYTLYWIQKTLLCTNAFLLKRDFAIIRLEFFDKSQIFDLETPTEFSIYYL